MTPLKQLLRCILLAAALGGIASGTAWAQDKVVYQISETGQALGGLRNIRNHLDVDPTAKIIVVAYGAGVDFLMEGAKDSNGSEFAGPVAALKNQGVKFEVCEITVRSRNLKKEQFLEEVDFTPSGVVRLTKLQLQHYAYIKP
jgi:hypothetical protein